MEQDGCRSSFAHVDIFMPELWFPAGLQGLRFLDTVDTLKRVILRTNLPPFSHHAVVQDTTSAAGPVQSAMPTPTCHL